MCNPVNSVGLDVHLPLRIIVEQISITIVHFVIKA